MMHTPHTHTQNYNSCTSNESSSLLHFTIIEKKNDKSFQFPKLRFWVLFFFLGCQIQIFFSFSLFVWLFVCFPLSFQSSSVCVWVGVTRTLLLLWFFQFFFSVSVFVPKNFILFIVKIKHVETDITNQLPPMG
mgnify:CR=1 FL=1